MSNLQEQDLWTGAIYLIERHDPLMGGEYGINNIQARQLACRTTWLRERLLAGHAPDGGHRITEGDIAKDAAISESKLILDCPTNLIGDEIARLAPILRKQTETLEGIASLDGSLYGPLYEALKLSWQYGYPRFAFELFNAVFSMRREIAPAQVLETVRGDDSIDVDDSSGLQNGATYVLWDKNEGRSKFVTVKKILTSRRVLLRHSEDITRIDSGELTSMSWQPGRSGMMSAPKGSKYVSRQIDILQGLAGGHLVIAHTGEADFIVEISRLPSTIPGHWERLPLVAREYHEKGGIYKSAWQVPGRLFSFRIDALSDCEIDHIAIASEHAKNSVSIVRTPRIVDNDFTIDRYGALYGVPHSATQFELSRNGDFRAGCLSLEFGSDGSKLPVQDYRARVISRLGNVTSGDEWWWRARYIAQNGDLSGYSGLGHYIHP